MKKVFIIIKLVLLFCVLRGQNVTVGSINTRMLSGTVLPNGVIIGNVGDTYYQNYSGVGRAWKKKTGNGTQTGWIEVADAQMVLDSIQAHAGGGAQTQLDAKTFSVPFLSNALDPLDATNYFFGGISNLIVPSTTNTNQDFVIGYNCTVVGCVIQAHGNTTQGSSEDVALSLRNNTAATSTTMGNFKTNATSTTTVVTAITGLNISVSASDLICLQMNGTWATNPTQVRLTGYLIIRL